MRHHHVFLFRLFSLPCTWKTINTAAFLFTAVLSCAFPVMAAPRPGADQKLTRCMHRAEQSPDHAAAEAEAWLKNGGGDKAMVCHAFTQFHRGEFEAAAREFASLAARHEKGDPKQAASLHVEAGLSFVRAGKPEAAETEYAAALVLEPHDPDIWLDRATARAAAERYWEALEDAGKALEIMPDMPEALRLRAQVRVKLGQDSAAKSDFEHAGAIESAEGAAASGK